MVKPNKLEVVTFFHGLESEDINLLASKFVPEAFPKDTVIFHQGDPANRLYILLAGTVLIRFKPHDGEILTVAEIQEGDVFGWSAALGRDAYTSQAMTTAESEVLSIGGSDLRDLCASHPKTGVVILERLAGVIADRLKNTHQKVVELLWRSVNSGDTH